MNSKHYPFHASQYVASVIGMTKQDAYCAHAREQLKKIRAKRSMMSRLFRYIGIRV